MQKITPSLWFDSQAEEAANFYTSIFKNSKVLRVDRYPEGSPAPAGSVMTVSFVIDGQEFVGLNGGPHFKFNEAVSFVVDCQSQDEVDYYWNKLTADGGEESMCGWLKDKYGLSWQIVPRTLNELLADPDPATANRVMGAMMQMKKLDVEKLKQAAFPDSRPAITIETIVKAPLKKVWQSWTQPDSVTQWNNASDDWHTPRAENDLRTGGSFTYRMEARDGSMGFDFGGVYDTVEEHQRICFTMSDGRKVQVTFSEVEGGTHVMETFEAENQNSIEMQRTGWQSILDNFKKYTENSN